MVGCLNENSMPNRNPSVEHRFQEEDRGFRPVSTWIRITNWSSQTAQIDRIKIQLIAWKKHLCDAEPAFFISNNGFKKSRQASHLMNSGERWSTTRKQWCFEKPSRVRIPKEAITGSESSEAGDKKTPICWGQRYRAGVRKIDWTQWKPSIK